MQPIVKTALLSDYALTSEDGKLSIMGIFGNINFPALPNAYPRFFVVIILTLDVGTHEVRIGIVDPVGQQMLPDPPTVPVNVEMAGADTNLVVGFDNLPFQRPGIYQIQLFVSGRLMHSVPLSIQSASASGLPPVQAN